MSSNNAPSPSTSSPLLKTTLSLVVLQLVSRLFSFSLNQLLLRSTTPQALGVATMGFEVVRDTSLFLIREGVRGAVMRTRSSSSSSRSSARFSQSLLIPTLLSPVLLLLFGLYSLVSSPSPVPRHYHTTLALYALSGLLELLSERYYLLTLVNWETQTSSRVRVEGAAVGVKSVATLLAIALGGEKVALLSFGVGQAAYGATLLVGLWAVVGRQAGMTWVPKAVKNDKIQGTDGRDTKAESTYFDDDIKRTSWALTKQSVVKQLLTEGDKIAVGRSSKMEDQGGYAVALNYGSLIARILFQPLEESSRLFFSRQLASPTPSASTLAATASLLSSLLLLQTHLSLIFLLLAPAYTSPLLYHLLGQRWSLPNSSAPTILRAYMGYYLPFMALNGITEAFFQSVASEVWLKRGSIWMGVCSLAFLATVVGGRKIGWGTDETGLIYANCVNMAMRIGFSAMFIRHYFSKHAQGEDQDLRDVWRHLSVSAWCPKIPTIIAFALAGAAVRWSERTREWRTVRGLGEHVALGAVCGLGCLAVVWVMERASLKRLRDVMLKRKSKGE